MDEGSTPSSFDSSAMSTSSSFAPGDRILAVKSSVDGIGWNDLHRGTLQSFVEQRPNFIYAQQSAIIEGTSIYTAYANNVHLRLGQHLRRAVNVLLNTRQRIVDLRLVLSAQGMDDDEIKHRIRQDIILPAQIFKQVISQQPINMKQLPQEHIYTRALEAFQPVFDTYDEGYNFGQQGLYYDVKHNPVSHFKAIYQLSHLFERL
ncbi:hypothetical protein CU097_002015, partial [Rhizopus azygosporus]